MRISKLRPAVKWHGGKHYLASGIVNCFPGHSTYVEPFAGGLSVLLNKRRCAVEVANDKNAELIAFYGVLRDQTGDFLARLASVPYTPETFDWSLQPGDHDDPISSVIRFLIRNRFSRGGLGEDFAWSDRLRGGRPGDLNAWETIKATLPRIAARLRGVELRCEDAVEVILEFDGPETLFYLDPPYVHGTRTARRTYQHEMTDRDHGRLLEVVTSCRGKVVISGYDNPLYRDELADWGRIEFEMPNNAGQTKKKQRRVEIVWLNPAC
jgi:DNA adenine methylase